MCANWRARLLMNLVLIRGGYPPVPVRPEDRPRYIAALNKAQAGGGDEAFRTLLYERLEESLEEILEAFAQARPFDWRRGPFNKHFRFELCLSPAHIHCKASAWISRHDCTGRQATTYRAKPDGGAQGQATLLVRISKGRALTGVLENQTCFGHLFQKHTVWGGDGCAMHHTVSARQ